MAVASAREAPSAPCGGPATRTAPGVATCAAPKGKPPDDSGPFFGYTQGGAALRKEGAPMRQFLTAVAAQVVAGVVVALILHFLMQ